MLSFMNDWPILTFIEISKAVGLTNLNNIQLVGLWVRGTGTFSEEGG